MVEKFKSTEIAVLPEKKEEKAKVSEKKAEIMKEEEKAEEPTPEVLALRKQLSDAEEVAKTERAKRIEAEKGKEEANKNVVSSQNDAVRAHESAITNAIEVANANLSQAKRDLREAMEGGDLDKQVDLQEKLADARWAVKGAEQNKKQFENWKEQQKTAVTKTSEVKTSQYTATERAWIDKHPRFDTDDEYYGVVAGADAAARRKGIKPDTPAYYEYVEAALKKSGLEKSQEDDGGRDNTGGQQDDEEETEAVVEKKPSAVRTAVSAPVTNASPNSGREKTNPKQFKLSAEMQDMAHRMFGPNSSHKLTNKQAEEKYAAYQIDIRDRRAAGEKV